MFEELMNKFEILKKDIIKPEIHQFYISKDNIREVLIFLKEAPSLLFERLDCLFAKDTGNLFELTYILQSDKFNTKLAISICLNYEEKILSVSDIFHSANFDEREIYDLFGIIFINHPDLKRILLPESFEGHPLRKDYDKMRDERLRWNYD